MISITINDLSHIEAVTVINGLPDYIKMRMGASVGQVVGDEPEDLTDGSLPQPDYTIPSALHDPLTGETTPIDELDAAGIPWIDGIHAKNKSKRVDQCWKSGNGVSVDMRAKAEAPYAAAATVGTPVPEMPPIPDSLKRTASAPIPTAASLAPSAPVSWDDLVARMNELSNEGKWTDAYQTDVYARAGVTVTSELQTNETLRSTLFDLLV